MRNQGKRVRGGHPFASRSLSAKIRAQQELTGMAVVEGQLDKDDFSHLGNSVRVKGFEDLPYRQDRRPKNRKGENAAQYNSSEAVQMPQEFHDN